MRDGFDKIIDLHTMKKYSEPPARNEMSDMEWKFRQIKEEETKVDARHLEHFKNEALDQIVHALIREDIQNRIDQAQHRAWATGNRRAPRPRPMPVRVRYCLSSQQQKVRQGRSSKWFAGIEQHLNAPECLKSLNSQPINVNHDISFLTIEDFNTTGLRGDTSQTRDPKGEQEKSEGRNDFYWFIRNVGRSSKKGSDKGRWGLGKIVYPASSGVRSFFAFSIRENDHQAALIGRSVLAIHTIDDAEYDSEGYYALFEDDNSPYFATPSSDQTAIEEFKRDFKVSRGGDEPGLSLVIPFPDESITYNNIIESALEHYFWEIFRGTIELEFLCGDKEQQIDKLNLKDFVSTWNGFDDDKKNEMRRMVDFCQKADKLSLQSDSYFELPEPASKTDPHVDQLLEEKDLESARNQFNDGELLAFECEISIKEESSERRLGSVLVYLQKDSELSSCSQTVIRDGLTIIGEKRIREPGIRALLLAEHPVVSSFLGDAETPSHTKWLASTTHFKGKYHHGPSTLSYIQYLPQRLATMLGRQDNVRLTELLKNVFSLAMDDDAENQKTGKKRGRNRVKKPTGIPKPRPQYISVRKDFENGGLKIQRAKSMVRHPDQVTVRVAYEISGGDPFHAHHPADFDFESSTNSPKVETLGCTEKQREPNLLVFNIEDEDFLIEISGFDKNRDLRIDAKASILDGNDEEEETP